METKERTNGRRIAKAVALAALMGLATLAIITIALECIRHLEYWYGENVAVVSVAGVVVVCAATLLGALLPERKKQ